MFVGGLVGVGGFGVRPGLAVGGTDVGREGCDVLVAGVENDMGVGWGVLHATRNHKARANPAARRNGPV